MTFRRGPQRHRWSLGLPPEPTLSFPMSRSLRRALSSILPTDWSFLRLEDWKCCSRHKAAVFQAAGPQGFLSRALWLRHVSSEVSAQLSRWSFSCSRACRRALASAGCDQAVTRTVQWDCRSSVVPSSGTGFPLLPIQVPWWEERGTCFLPTVNRKGWKCNQK